VLLLFGCAYRSFHSSTCETDNEEDGGDDAVRGRRPVRPPGSCQRRILPTGLRLKRENIEEKKGVGGGSELGGS